MNGHDVIWTQPPALLTDRPTAAVLATTGAALEKPAILRFATDSFMDDFMNLAQTRPEGLRDYHVRRETWRGFTPEPVVAAPKRPSLVLQRLGVLGRALSSPVGVASAAVAEQVPAGTPLKLYQPAQQRFYLVASSLVCRVTGLPDRTVEASRGETVGCVIRRLLPPTSDPQAPVDQWEEHAWVAASQGCCWQNVGTDAQRVVEGEERLPLFAVHFKEHEGRSRRLFAGVIPVGRREAYLGAPRSDGNGNPGVTKRTSRKILLRRDVIEPWKALLRHAQEVQASFTGPFVEGFEAPGDTAKAARLKIEREQAQTASWFILLDFAKYLATYLKPVWRAVLDPGAAQLTTPQRAVYDALGDTTLGPTLRERLRYRTELTSGGTSLFGADHVPGSLRDALAKFGSAPDAIDSTLEQKLDTVDRSYDRYADTNGAVWPDFFFPLADADLPGDAPLPLPLDLPTLTDEERSDLSPDAPATDALGRLDKLAVLIVRALEDDEAEPAPQPAVPTAAIAPASALEGWFRIRCVYERPACEPLHRSVVSEPTDRFLMAGFFDPDAPARPIRIGLPIDTTPGGLRKFDKNTAFVISDTLCGQIKRVKGLTFGDLVLSVLPWPFHKDLPGADGGPCKSGELSLGMICSLSIPIITLCAFILLMIMVSLFDLIFRWIPYFIICFPLPGLKAKKT